MSQENVEIVCAEGARTHSTERLWMTSSPSFDPGPSVVHDARDPGGARPKGRDGYGRLEPTAEAWERGAE